MNRCWRTLLGVTALLPIAGLAADTFSCPPEFPQFLARFESDFQFQASTVQFPLFFAYLDAAAEPEPKRRTKRVSRESYTKAEYPYYPTPDIQAKRKLEKNIIESSSSKKVVRFNQPDSDAYSIEYHFKKVRQCWRLTFVEDYSL